MPRVFVWVMSGPKHDDRNAQKGVGEPMQTDNNGCQPTKDEIRLTQECECFISGAVTKHTVSVGGSFKVTA